MTNFESVKNMNLYKMARTLYNIEYYVSQVKFDDCDSCGLCCINHMCPSRIKYWLEQDVIINA